MDGLLKDSTQCAPNGYYFIPVYDKVLLLLYYGFLFLLYFTIAFTGMKSVRRWYLGVYYYEA